MAESDKSESPLYSVYANRSLNVLRLLLRRQRTLIVHQSNTGYITVLVFSSFPALLGAYGYPSTHQHHAPQKKTQMLGLVRSGFKLGFCVCADYSKDKRNLFVYECMLIDWYASLVRLTSPTSNYQSSF